MSGKFFEVIFWISVAVAAIFFALVVFTELKTVKLFRYAEAFVWVIGALLLAISAYKARRGGERIKGARFLALIWVINSAVIFWTAYGLP